MYYKLIMFKVPADNDDVNSCGSTCFILSISVFQGGELLVARSKQTDPEGRTVPQECGDIGRRFVSS